MKHTMKKAFAILVSLMLVFSLSVMAFAAGEGSITVTNAKEGEAYNAYKILALESYDADTGIYLYKADAVWADFVNSAANYLTVDAGGYVTWVENADVKAFAKEALAYAEAQSIAATASATVGAGETSATISGLDLGYYLVDSTLGTILAITTTDPTAEFAEKNSGPSVDKEVEEDSTSTFGKENDADLFQTINFKATITAKAGAKKYVLHDKMDAGLTYLGVTKVTLNGDVVDASNYTVKTSGLTDGCTFEVEFAQAFLDTLADDDSIVVEYQGQLNENALISTAVNKNEVKLTYGDASSTEVVTTETSTYEFDIVKTDSDNKVLPGAEFKLYDAKTGGNEIKVVQKSEGVYRVAKADEVGVAMVVPASGVITVQGLDGQTTYYLEETKAPDGYNGLTERVEVSITDSNLKATVTDGEYVSGGIQVINKTGSVLPETGGIGTTIFTIVGVTLVVGAAVLLFVKKRASSIAE